jgi:anti-anti-sigma factor
MSLHVEIEQTEEIAVLKCGGRMVGAEALGFVKDVVTRLSPLRVIVLDLSGVAMLDAHGLGMLVSLHNSACAADIELKVVNPSKLVREMLELTGLTSVLHVSSLQDIIEVFCASNPAIENVTRGVA